ncbi:MULTISPECIES: Glu/Leu/Phe/Val dehydrogenase dimerization domain-containing protein [unclassified Pseudovibrio]|uniref:Glu/Leu/Phe/Val family dehydrogenase n=1 Tax=unclassified Pseudovibrio TaxID=2627060 RepID=UPI0007AE45AB|nr:MULTISPECIES: Glu/Leu/Phe/Val dehydrogenase dimerization domain-containing protein [unclassified Pseudovibrio]KZK93060.1 Leucine dehydrogenase [Pseudovibrio sp. W74]KZL04366.1 Leucine dehydrogenase [Pseudovibrio sp. Ad14]
MNVPLHNKITIDTYMTPLDHPEFAGHEQIVFATDNETGLKAIIAVHNTNRGPGLGGCRMWNYASANEALTDVLRLSKGMTYKNALADLALGGGKSVIIANPRTDKTPELLRAFGRHINRLSGSYITAEDVGISSDDMEIIGSETQFARGTDATGFGDPSPYTALGTFVGIKAAAKHKFGSEDLSGLTVSLKGLGHVGYDVARQLHEAGANLIVSDIYDPAVTRAIEELGASSVSPDDAHLVKADIFAPCALGGGLNAATIPELKVAVVAGAANNQLETQEDGTALMKRGILYAPDYAINAGGVISVALGEPGASDSIVRQKTLAIGGTLAQIFDRADAEKRPTNIIADELAEERFQHHHNPA